MTQNGLAAYILDGLQWRHFSEFNFSEFNFSEQEFDELVSLANEVCADKKKLSEWETGRIKLVPENYLKLWKAVLGLEANCKFEKLKLPVITKEEFENPYVQCAVEFLEYVLTMKQEDRLNVNDEYASRHVMRDLMEDFFTANKNSSLL